MRIIIATILLFSLSFTANGQILRKTDFAGLDKQGNIIQLRLYSDSTYTLNHVTKGTTVPVFLSSGVFQLGRKKVVLHPMEGQAIKLKAGWNFIRMRSFWLDKPFHKNYIYLKIKGKEGQPVTLNKIKSTKFRQL